MRFTLKKIYKKIKSSAEFTFFGGILIGAFITISINILSSALDQQVNRQHALESIEAEILHHNIQLETISKHKDFLDYNGDVDIDTVYILSERFTTYIWDGENINSFIFGIPKDQLMELMKYYALVENTNVYLDLIHDDLLSDYKYCASLAEDNLNDEVIDECVESQNEYLQLVLENLKNLESNNNEILASFQPSNDRLDKPYLKLLMGNDDYRKVIMDLDK